MTLVDLLSDTVYRQQAVKQLHELLDGANEFPVKSTQIYGLRQIARQEPEEVGGFAIHQGQRAQSSTEVNFWTLVANFCGDLPDHWSVRKVGRDYLPEEFRDENLRKVPGENQHETRQNQQHNNKLRKGQREWFEKWENEHVPAFFERFCTHCLYCIAKAEMGELASESVNEADELEQQDQSNNQDGGTMQTALKQAELVE